MRSLNLDQLRAFVQVAERGSFTAAAKYLNLTQPAVTHQVQELERRFKVTLVERLGKRAHLTQAGEELIEHARHLLEEDNRTHVAMRRFDDGWLGRVRIGTSMTILMYLLPPILRQLKTDHPQLEMELKAGLTTNTLQMLKSNALDLGLCAFPIEDSDEHRTTSSHLGYLDGAQVKEPRPRIIGVRDTTAVVILAQGLLCRIW
jgi:DNA-binding transcriptional LysR family regulator